MYALEFESIILNKTISLPINTKNLDSKKVKVILLFENSEDSNSNENYIQNLMNHPINVKDFIPLKREDIYEHQ
jgi:ureidoglycolate hydrolase